MSEFVNTGAYPARSGNRVYPLVDGIPAFRRICDAIESAQKSVSATITFMWASFEMPDNRGTALRVLDNAAQRGIDVRLIFWRPDDHMESHRRNAFWGSPEHFKLLARDYSNINIRWDRAARGYCQHQKSWLVDAELDTSTAFVGGINLNPNSVVQPGHHHSHNSSAPQNHDVYVELRGPSVADVHHNFVQRWNEASERTLADGFFGSMGRDDLPFPSTTPKVCGEAVVQIQRTTHKGLYESEHPPVNAGAFRTAMGERTNLDQYCATIRSAKRTIYIENQYIEVEPIVAALEDALCRGVEVLVVLPVRPDYSLRDVDTSDPRKAFLQRRAALAEHENFMLCGLAAEDSRGSRRPVYVHSKLIIVDGVFASVGSCNLHHYSLFGNGELNAAIKDFGAAFGLMRELFQEHIDTDVSGCDDLEAIRQFKRTASDNLLAGARSDKRWRGIAFEMDMSTYGERDQPLTK